jgi:hypothetical protein
LQDNDIASRRYLNREYAAKDPSWDVEDSPWEAERVYSILDRNRLKPATVAGVGCGAGGVLAALRKKFADAELYGADIALTASRS